MQSISLEWLRGILDEADVSRQSRKTWKESKDPEFDRKKRRIDRLTHRKHKPPVVLSADEIGPVSLEPNNGMGRCPAGRRVHVIQDDLGAHWTPEVRAWARKNNVSLVPTATNASWFTLWGAMQAILRIWHCQAQTTPAGGR